MTEKALKEVLSKIGVPQYKERAGFAVERGYIWTSCASVENGNPLYWDDEVAERVGGGVVAPPSMLSVWFRPHHWAPGRSTAQLPLQVHFDLKDRLGLPEAVMTDNTIVFHEPARTGDLIGTCQILRSVSDAKTTKLGTGRFWVIDVEYRNQRGEVVGVESYTGFGYRRPSDGFTPEVAAPEVASPDVASPEVAAPDVASGSRDSTRGVPRGPEDEHTLLLAQVSKGQKLPLLSYDVTTTTVILGALASRDWRPMHHDRDFAQNHNGTPDIFMNTPNQAAWFERYLTDFTGPYGRLGRMTFRMSDSVFPGDRMVLSGVVDDVAVDDAGCGWLSILVELRVGGALRTSCQARVAVPSSAQDNPWQRRGEEWRP